MSEQAHFSYEGNVVLNLKNLTKSPVKRPIEIKKLVNLIPVQIHFDQGGESMVVTGYMNYSENAVELPSSSLEDIDDPEAFKAALTDFVQFSVLPQNPDQSNLSKEEMKQVYSNMNNNTNVHDYTNEASGDFLNGD